LGTSGRNLRNWVHQREKFPELEEDEEHAGKRRYFLIADGVEAVARRSGRWPPGLSRDLPSTHGDAATWQELTLRQGRDLELARKARADADSRLDLERQTNRQLRAEIRRLEAQLRELAIAAEALAKVNRQTFAPSPTPDREQ
jgi:hypothetical protein